MDDLTENENQEYLSESAYQKLKDELDHRSGAFRKEIAEKISAARAEGDLKENGGYHAARDEQGKNEARINELKFRLENATIISGDAKDEKAVVSPGKLVTAILNDSNQIKFILGSRENANYDEGIDAFSPTSALGQAINGKDVGAETSYKAPNGKEITVKIIDAHYI